jgi:hypothetical protein
LTEDIGHSDREVIYIPVLLDVKEKHSAVTCPHIEIKSKELRVTMVHQVQLRLEIHANLHSPLFERTFWQQSKWSVHRNHAATRSTAEGCHMLLGEFCLPVGIAR